VSSRSVPVTLHESVELGARHPPAGARPTHRSPRLAAVSLHAESQQVDDLAVDRAFALRGQGAQLIGHVGRQTDGERDGRGHVLSLHRMCPSYPMEWCKMNTYDYTLEAGYGPNH
jgi:hypothetical protein